MSEEPRQRMVLCSACGGRRIVLSRCGDTCVWCHGCEGNGFVWRRELPPEIQAAVRAAGKSFTHVAIPLDESES
jgi:hypothetical protein